jgi:DUF1680 family protein
MPANKLSRRKFLKAAGATTALTMAAGASGSESTASLLAAPSQASAQSIFPFPLNQVTLQTGTAPFTGNRDRTHAYLLFLDNDRMLFNFKVTAGLSTNGAQALGGWEAPDVKLRGHGTGHYLKALAQAYASTSDSQFRTKINYMVTELKKCQDASPSRGFSSGYLAAYSEDQFVQLENLATYPTIWAPYYTCHKIMAGLLSCYQLAGNTTALDIVTKMADWVFGRLSRLTRARLQQMWALYIAGEFGGMNETLAELHAITGNPNHLTAATFFDNDNLFVDLSNNLDRLDGKHANQHIPQVTGALAVFDRNNTPLYYTVANNFWNIVTSAHLYAIGGTGQAEFFRAANAIASLLTDNNCESCATYNMLKLSRALFFHTGDAKYIDYYERALYNHILANQNQAASHGFTTYFMPLAPGSSKGFSNDYNNWTCCHSTGMESPTKFQDTIYAFSGDTLYVNLFIPSTLNWASRGLTVTQTTSYPESNTTRLTIGGSGHIALKVRVPSWVQTGWQLRINNVAQNLNPTLGSYVTVDRTWANGDVVDITMPMAISFEPTPDNANVKAVKFGGVVLCSAWTTTTMPTLNQSSVTATATPLQFNATVNGSTAVTLLPFYKKFSGAYTVYFATNGSPPGPTPTPGVGPLHRYQFEGNANDSGSSVANGTLVNAPTFVAGRVGQAVNLDGSNDHVSLPAGIVNGLTNFTIATWVKLDTTAAWRRIFDFGTGTTVNMFLVPTAGSAIRFAITTGGSGAEQRINGTSALPTGAWKHVAVTLSGNLGILYVDGVEVGRNSNITLRPSSLGNTTNNWLGRSQYADPFLDGQIDEFRIYNRALSVAELQSLFQNP